MATATARGSQASTLAGMHLVAFSSLMLPHAVNALGEMVPNTP